MTTLKEEIQRLADEGFEPNEIAEILQCSPSWVRQCLSRADLPAYRWLLPLAELDDRYYTTKELLDLLPEVNSKQLRKRLHDAGIQHKSVQGQRNLKQNSWAGKAIQKWAMEMLEDPRFRAQTRAAEDKACKAVLRRLASFFGLTLEGGKTLKMPPYAWTISYEVDPKKGVTYALRRHTQPRKPHMPGTIETKPVPRDQTNLRFRDLAELQSVLEQEIAARYSKESENVDVQE
ncbi:MAG: hypothetical protein KDC71_21660 [Acidobacteria bacterium]|nr:hypothetical protein [Acidobacteriota bacterium]